MKGESWRGVLLWTSVAAAFEFRFDVTLVTRPSSLAKAQAELVAASLMIATPGTTTSIVPLTTDGDIDQRHDVPLAKAGIDFTSVIDAAVIEGTFDIGVHSLKDVPPQHRWMPSLTIGCHLPRVCPLDVIVGATTLDELGPGARVGTASIRRQAQLKAARPDLTVVNVRGDVLSRLAQLEAGDVDALVLAKAGIERLGIEHRVMASELPPEVMLPGVGQGIICAVCRGNGDVLRLLRSANDRDAHVAAAAERAFLDVLDATSPWSGRPPLGALMARVEGGWRLNGLLARPDGTRVIRVERSAPVACSVAEAEALGRDAAEELTERAGAHFLH